MDAFHKKLIDEYREIKEMFSGSAKNQLRVSEHDYGRLSQTLRVLVDNEHLININADNAYFYIKNSSFAYFEDQLRAEINEPLPKLFSLFEEVDLIREEFQSLEDLFEPTLHDVPRFIVWKSKVEYELQKLNPAEIANQCLGQLNGFNGLNDEELFNKVAANLAVIVENYEDFISPPQSEQLQKIEEVMKEKKLFISHATLDKDYVELLVGLLEAMGLDDTNLFCSSVPGYGIPLNQPMFDFLRENFNRYDLHVIFVHSENFYNRPVCLNEMGAAWVARSKHTSILLPAFDFASMVGVVKSDNTSIKLDDDISEVRHRLNELYDILVEDFNLTKKSSIIWERKRDAFIEQINAIIPSHGKENREAVVSEPSIDPNVIKLLSTANDSPAQSGIIIKATYLSGTMIQAGDVQINKADDNRDTAKWESVLKDALANGFIVSASRNGNVFKLTHKAYKLLETLE